MVLVFFFFFKPFVVVCCLDGFCFVGRRPSDVGRVTTHYVKKYLSPCRGTHGLL